jgi:hypothetical protein
VLDAVSLDGRIILPELDEDCVKLLGRAMVKEKYQTKEGDEEGSKRPKT